MRLIKNWYLKKLSKNHGKVSNTNYEIPSLVFFLNIRSKKKKKLFYLTHFLIKLSYKYSLRMVCLFLLKRFLYINVYKFILKWKKMTFISFDYNNIFSLLHHKITFRKKLLFKLKNKISFYFSIFFYYNILYFSYFSKLFIYLNKMSIKEIFVFFYIYNIKKHNITVYFNNYYLLWRNKKNNYFIDLNKIDFFTHILFLLKKKIFIKKKMNSLFKFFLIKKSKLKLIITSLLVLLNKKNIHFNYSYTYNLILKLDSIFHTLLPKQKKANWYVLPNNKILNLISVFLKKHIIWYNDSVMKSYNWFSFFSFSKLKWKKTFFNYINNFQYFIKNKFRRVFYKTRKRFYRFLHNWVKHNGSLLPSYRRAKLFAHFRGHIYIMKQIFLSPLSFNNKFEFFIRKKHINKVFWSSQRNIRYKLISILGKKQLLKELSFPLNSKQWFHLYLKFFYNMTITSFLFFSKNLEHKKNVYKIKDILFLVNYKFNIFIKKYFSCSIDSIKKLYSLNQFNKKNLSNVILSIGDIVFFNHENRIHFDTFFVFLHFIFFIDPIRLKIKEDILIYLYRFIHHILFIEYINISSFFKKIVNRDHNELYISYWKNYFKVITKFCNFSYKIKIKSLLFYYYKYNYYDNRNVNILLHHDVSKSHFNFLNKNSLLSIYFFDVSYMKYKFVTFKKKMRLFGYFNKKNYIKHYILSNRYWKLKKWRFHYSNLIKKTLNFNKENSHKLFFLWCKRNNHFSRWYKYFWHQNKKKDIKQIIAFKKRNSFFKKKLKKNTKWSPYFKSSPYFKGSPFLPSSFYKNYMLKNLSFFNKKKNIKCLI